MISIIHNKKEEETYREEIELNIPIVRLPYANPVTY